MKRSILSISGAVLLAWLCIGVSKAGTVSSVEQLNRAIADAQPGDTITLAPGRYEIERITLSKPGLPLQPITLRAAELGTVHIDGTGAEILKVTAPYWVFENLDIGGSPGSEHAFHIVGAASHTIVRHNLLHDFDAMVKGNGEGEPRVFPNDVLIEDNIMVDSKPRTDGAPVTPIDVVGGKRWILRGNFIADFAKDGGNGVSYGAFLKGDSSDGVIERNLVICEWKNRGGVRIGLSLGGGGTGAGLCEGDDCSVEHRSGTIRNNVVMNCTEDVGIYLNKAKDSYIANNSLINTNGIDVRFPVSSANVAGNIISGGVRARDDARVLLGENYVVGNDKSVQGHKGMLWFESKIEGASKKHPSLLHEDWAKRLIAWVADADGWLGASKWGRGDSQLASLFVDPAAGNLALQSSASVAAPSGAVNVSEDFCGHARTGDSRSFGAIEYGAGSCDVSAQIAAAEAVLVQSSAGQSSPSR